MFNSFLYNNIIKLLFIALTIIVFTSCNSSTDCTNIYEYSGTETYTINPKTEVESFYGNKIKLDSIIITKAIKRDTLITSDTIGGNVQFDTTVNVSSYIANKMAKLILSNSENDLTKEILMHEGDTLNYGIREPGATFSSMTLKMALIDSLGAFSKFTVFKEVYRKDCSNWN